MMRFVYAAVAALIGGSLVAPAVAAPADWEFAGLTKSSPASYYWTGAGANADYDALARGQGAPIPAQAAPVWEYAGVARHLAELDGDLARDQLAFDAGDLSNTYVAPDARSFAIAEAAVAPTAAIASLDDGDLSNTYVAPDARSFAIAEAAVAPSIALASLDDGDLANTYVAPQTVLAFLEQTSETLVFARAETEWDAAGATGDTPVKPRDWDGRSEDPAAMLRPDFDRSAEDPVAMLSPNHDRLAEDPAAMLRPGADALAATDWDFTLAAGDTLRATPKPFEFEDFYTW